MNKIYFKGKGTQRNQRASIRTRRLTSHQNFIPTVFYSDLPFKEKTKKGLKNPTKQKKSVYTQAKFVDTIRRCIYIYIYIFSKVTYLDGKSLLFIELDRWHW